MIKMKSCPRCKGDLIIEQSYKYRVEHCIQCGYERESIGIEAVRQMAVDGPKTVRGN